MDTTASPQLADRDNLILTIEGIYTGGRHHFGSWKWNGTIINRHTQVTGGSFYDGGGEAIVGTGPCEDRMYRVALIVTGYLPGNYTYFVSNSDTPTPVKSPVFLVEGILALW